MSAERGALSSVRDLLSADLLAALGALAVADRPSFYTAIGLAKEERDYLTSSGWAFLTGLIADQSVKSLTAWRLPLRLAMRARVDELPTLDSIGERKLASLLGRAPALHRYPSGIARYLHGLYSKWGPVLGSRPESLWEEAESVSKLRERLTRLPGIGPKKASVGTLILIAESGISLAGLDDLPLAIDVHVRRVLGRCLSDRITSPSDDNLQQLAAIALPSSPGQLSTPIWEVGRRYCHPSLPACAGCPLEEGCGHNS
jgi:endonuclease III